jgi:hypothetical protein
MMTGAGASANSRITAHAGAPPPFLQSVEEHVLRVARPRRQRSVVARRGDGRLAAQPPAVVDALERARRDKPGWARSRRTGAARRDAVVAAASGLLGSGQRSSPGLTAQAPAATAFPQAVTQRAQRDPVHWCGYRS